MKKLFAFAMTALVFAACATSPKTENTLPLYAAADFDTIIDGKKVELFTLQNENGMTAQITNYGAIVVDLWVQAADQSFKNVMLGYPSISAYFDVQNPYHAAVIGPFANRIGKGQFSIDGKQYQLQTNNGENTLHGTAANFAKKVWDATPITKNTNGEQMIEMTYVSPDGIYGFPGNLTTKVRYTLTTGNGLKIEYEATTDAPTVINLTNHAYFNLHGGDHKTSTNSHMLMINADNYTATDAGLITTGEILPVEGTALDFREPHMIGERVLGDYPAFEYRLGYDHNFVINRPQPGFGEVITAALLVEPSTGIVMSVLTDTPGIQFYSGRSRQQQDTAAPGYRSAVALETQNYPDAPNHPEFPSAVLRPGEIYRQTCIYQFASMNIN